MKVNGSWVVAAVTIAATMSGCSWFLMDRHEKTAAGRPLCSTTKGWAALDGIVAAGAFVSAGLTNSAGQDAADAGVRDVGSYRTAVALLIVDGVVHVAAALTGISWASSCREDIDRFESRGAVPSGLAPSGATTTGDICFQLEEEGVRRRLCGASFEECDLARDDTMRRLTGAPISTCYDVAGPPAPLVRPEPPAPPTPAAPAAPDGW